MGAKAQRAPQIALVWQSGCLTECVEPLLKIREESPAINCERRPLLLLL